MTMRGGLRIVMARSFIVLDGDEANWYQIASTPDQLWSVSQ
jgi:hypothetical protein